VLPGEDAGRRLALPGEETGRRSVLPGEDAGRRPALPGEQKYFSATRKLMILLRNILPKVTALKLHRSTPCN